jgi:hypothetical protein
MQDNRASGIELIVEMKRITIPIGYREIAGHRALFELSRYMQGKTPEQCEEKFFHEHGPNLRRKRHAAITFAETTAILKKPTGPVFYFHEDSRSITFVKNASV